MVQLAMDEDSTEFNIAIRPFLEPEPELEHEPEDSPKH